MPCKFMSLNGKELVTDLDRVIGLLEGYLSHKQGWIALIVYDPIMKKFIELRDSPPDIKGNSKSECVEVTLDYIENEFSISRESLNQFFANPYKWTFLDLKN